MSYPKMSLKSKKQNNTKDFVEEDLKFQENTHINMNHFATSKRF
jgi:hypothetical protein